MKKTAPSLFIPARCLLLAVMTSFAATVSAAADDDNIVVADEKITYVISADGKEPGQVKMTEQTTYEATRVDDWVYATTMFNEDVSIDKASAPGAKPYYRSWEPGDLFYTGSRICLMKVPVKGGKTAKVTFEKTYKTSEQFCNVFLASSYFTRRSDITIEVPPPLIDRITIEPYNLAEGMEFYYDTARNGNIIYGVRCTDRKPFKYESGAPSAAVEAPQLIVRGRFRDVGELYKFFKRYDTLDGDTEGRLDALAAKITAGCTSDIEKIDSVASWVRQNIRYVAVEHGEYGIKPAKPSEVLTKLYGDCKGSANLIKALLVRNGIDARMVWIGTAGDVTFDWDQMPSLMSGNHQIAAAFVGDSIVYIDGTSSYAPAGYVPYAIRGQQALIEDGDSYLLRRVPCESRFADYDSLTARFAIAGSDLVGSIERRFSGTPRTAVANSLMIKDAVGRKSFIRKMLSWPKKNLSCETVGMELDSPSAPYCRLMADEVIDRGAARAIGDKIFVDLCPVRDYDFAVYDLKGRTRGLAPSPHTPYKAEITLDIPEGYAFESLPASTEIDNEWFGGFIDYSLEESTLVCRVMLTPRRTEASLNEVSARNDAVKAINRLSDTKLVLVKTI